MKEFGIEHNDAWTWEMGKHYKIEVCIGYYYWFCGQIGWALGYLWNCFPIVIGWQWQMRKAILSFGGLFLFSSNKANQTYHFHFLQSSSHIIWSYRNCYHSKLSWGKFLKLEERGRKIDENEILSNEYWNAWELEEKTKMRLWSMKMVGNEIRLKTVGMKWILYYKSSPKHSF